ncbi:MAG: DUF2235 domain-containing protein [Verrucomicrobiales bacterium]|nr:DUF2235 domain-containing protein [Verrucomicrobiales bacterium]
MSRKIFGEPLEEKIGIRSGSRVIPVIVLLLSCLFFIARHEPSLITDSEAKELHYEEELVAAFHQAELIFKETERDGLLSWIRDISGSFFAVINPVAKRLAGDIPNFFMFLFQIAAWVALYALIPGLAGNFYRGNFTKYFFTAVVILLGIEVVHLLLPNHLTSIAQGTKNKLIFSFEFYLGWLGVFLVWFLAFHVWVYNFFRGLSSFFIRKDIKDRTPKNIVVCLDGTWNHPGQMDHGRLAHTNVFKLFKLLKGEALTSKVVRRQYNANLVKRYKNEAHEQVGLYYNGVGNKIESSQAGQMFGGIFGMGADAIMERAWLDIVKEYNPGDRIYIFGFSRGAALARLVAGAVGRRGIPRSAVTLRLFGRIRPIMELFGRYDDVQIDVLGCWDTVGAFGIAKNILGIPFQKIDLLKDLTIGDHVKQAYHLVSLDENRDAFEPTLMDPDPIEPSRIIEVWFSGNHSNVGGGYATDGLSNGSFSFMLEHISSGYRHEGNRDETGKIRPMGDESWGIYLNAIKCRKSLPGEGGVKATVGEKEWEVLPVEATEAEAHQRLFPDPRGKIRTQGGPYLFLPRKVPSGGVIHDTVFERMQDGKVAYAPESVLQLSQEISRTKRDLAEKIDELREIRALNSQEIGLIDEWLASALTIRKWSAISSDEGHTIDYEGKLKNPVTVG